jgi:hypothetical protein
MKPNGSAAPVLRLIANEGGSIDGQQPALIPPGEYRVRFVDWSTGILFGRVPKVTIWFSVTDFGEYFESRLPRHYNATKLVGKQGRHGQFKVGRHSDLLLEFATLAGFPNRTDRIALTQLQNMVIVALVETVTKNHRQQALPLGLHYSVIRKLVRCEAGTKR